MNPVILSYLWYHVPDSLDCVMESLGSLNMVHVHAQHLLVISFTSITPHHIDTPSTKHYTMIKQISHFKLARNLLAAGPHLGIGSYRRFPITQVRYRLINKVGLHPLTFFLRGNPLQNRYPTFPTVDRSGTVHLM